MSAAKSPSLFSRCFDRDVALLLVLALAKLAFHVATNNQYGFHRDELATLDDARHLAWGYVAYPPLTPFLGYIALNLFGTSLTGFRFFAVLAQSTVMVVTGLMARRFGGGRAAMLVAACAVAIAPISLAASALFQYVSFDYLWFVLAAYFVVCRIDSGDARWWLAIGAAIGLGVLTKYTVAFYATGLVTGVLLTPLRADLRSRWLWLGIAAALVITAPNLIWQVQHDFISLEFLKSVHARDVRIGRADGFWLDQIRITTNPLTLPLWGLGLYHVVFGGNGRWRVLAWMALVPFALFVLARARGYYTGPLYPMLLAAGAATLQCWISPRSLMQRRIGWSMVSLLLLAGTIVTPVVVPLTQVGSPEFKLVSRLNGDFVEEIGWPELVRETARIWNGLTPNERLHTEIFSGNYGEAGAIDLYGDAYGLPPTLSNVNSYWLRGPGMAQPQTLIVLGSRRETLERVCTSVELAGHIDNDAHVQNEETESHPDIFLCRGLKKSLQQMWPTLRDFG